MRVLVCGGRNFAGDSMFKKWMLGTADLFEEATVIIHGGAKGADAMASAWARSHAIPEFIFHANWNAHGKSAGPRRNQAMLDVGKPDIVIAFPGGVGTADMIRRAKAAGVTVIDTNEPCSDSPKAES